MTTALTTFNPAALKASLKRTAKAADPSAAFLKMEKTGAWVFGINGTEVAPDEDEFYVDPRTFGHGYVAWERDNGGAKLGEIMGPVTETIPATGPTPDGSDGWQFQLGLGLVALDGATPLIFRTTSVGGKRAIGELAEAVAEACEGDKPVAVVTLGAESYKHKKYGKIFNPTITVKRWATMATLEKAVTGDAPSTAPKLPAPAAKKAAVKRAAKK